MRRLSLNKRKAERKVIVTSELTGEQIDTYSEAWRHETECRHVLGMLKVRGAATEFIARVSKRRGEQAGKRLFDDSMKLKEKRLEAQRS